MTRLRDQRVLVTGAGGFVGRHLVAQLRREGAHVVALTRASCDLTDPVALTRAVRVARPDLALHLAAARDKTSTDDRVRTAAVNATSGLLLVEALPDSCRAVVRLGSSTEYAASAVPMDEQTPLRPRGFFGATKAAGSLLLTAAAEERGLRSCVLRAFQVYGPGDKPTRFVPTVLDAARRGAAVDLTAPGLRRDWVWVGDVVEACLRAALRDDLPGGTVLNIGTGTQTSNEDLVALAGLVAGGPVATRVGRHPGRSWDTADWACDPSAARRELGWEPTVPLREGLERCWSAVVAGRTAA